MQTPNFPCRIKRDYYYTVIYADLASESASAVRLVLRTSSLWVIVLPSPQPILSKTALKPGNGLMIDWQHFMQPNNMPASLIFLSLSVCGGIG